jgi:hypothetical protein
MADLESGTIAVRAEKLSVNIIKVDQPVVHAQAS